MGFDSASGDNVESKELRIGSNEPNTVAALAPFQPGFGHFDLLSDGADRVVALESETATLLDPTTGAAILAASLTDFDTATTSPRDYAVASNGIYHYGYRPDGFDGRSTIDFFSFATRQWQTPIVPDYVWQDQNTVFAADESGLYVIVNGANLERIDPSGRSTTLATGLAYEDFVRYDTVVLGKDNVCFSGGRATSSGISCGDLIADPFYVIRSVPKAGGKVSTLRKADDSLSLGLRAGDDKSLVLASRCKDAGLWIMPSDGTAAPKSLSAAGSAVRLVSLRKGSDYVYFSNAGGAIQRVCRAL